MQPPPALAVLDRADAAEALPRLGGMARPNGVVIVSERHWAFAGRDGTVRRGAMPQPPALGRWLPLMRGLIRLGAALSPLFRRRGVTRGRERTLLAFALVAPFALVFLPARVGLAAGVALAVGLIAFLFRGRTLQLHGAEHRAIAAVEGRCLVESWHGGVRPSRFSLRCGTNFAALALPVSVSMQWLWPLPIAAYTPFAIMLLSLALTMEFWQAVQGSRNRVARAFLVPGLALQRLTTREPELGETRIALTAVAAVLDAELAARR